MESCCSGFDGLLPVDGKMTTSPSTALADWNEADLWSAYTRQRDSEARLALIERYVPLAKRVASQLYKRRHDDMVEFGDYMQYALVGLIEAIDRYDPDREAAFATFAMYRIRGTILNGLEKATERNEQIAYRQRLRKERIESVADQTGAKPSNEIFAELVDVAIGLAVGYMLEGTNMVANERNESDEKHGYNSTMLSQIKNQLCHLVDTLPARERTIIRFHYFHQVGFFELAQLLGLTKGRVSQLHKMALKQIREAYENESMLDTLY